MALYKKFPKHFMQTRIHLNGINASTNANTLSNIDSINGYNHLYSLNGIERHFNGNQHINGKRNIVVQKFGGTSLGL